MGPLIPLFWTSRDVSSGFQSSGQSYLHLAEAETHTCDQALVGLEQEMIY